MIFIYGHRLYGKVDEVPGIGHVATRFGHLNHVPLFPMGSYLVVEKQGDEFIGAPIGLNGKSILTTYLRAACWLWLIVSGVVLTINALDSKPNRVAQIVAWGSQIAMSTLVLAGSYRLGWFARASQQRAEKLLNSAATKTEQGRQIVEMLLNHPRHVPGAFPVIPAGGGLRDGAASPAPPPAQPSAAEPAVDHLPRHGPPQPEPPSPSPAVGDDLADQPKPPARPRIGL